MNPLTFFTDYLDEPLILLLIIPLFIFILFMARRPRRQGERRRKTPAWITLSRTLLFLLILIALASPYVLDERISKGKPFVKMLVDNSSSLELFDSGVAERIQVTLKQKLDVEVYPMSTAERSAIGDGIISHLGDGETVLLISDGQNTHGADFGDVALHANKKQGTVNAIDLEPMKDEYAISIFGPGKVTAGAESVYTIVVSGTDERAHHVIVSVDGRTVKDTTTDQEITITERFTEGYHQLTAELDTQDHFSQNNKFHKTVKVVEKPPLLIYTEKPTPLAQLLEDLYDVTVTTTLPSTLDSYYGVIVNDIPAQVLDPSTSVLSDYLSEGNGLLVVGGKNSYEYGGYKESTFETILPTFVATSEKKEGEINLIVVIDISGSTGSGHGDSSTVDIEKSLAIGAIEDIGIEHSVGVVAFDTEGHIVSDLNPLIDTNQDDLKSKILQLTSGGGTLISAGIFQATQLLKKGSGSKNIILISDGNTQDKTAAKAAAQQAENQGVKIFTIGVGINTNENIMKEIADIGHGAYFKATDAHKIRVLFGNPDQEVGKDSHGLVVLDDNHFITEQLRPYGSIYGFNDVVPKTTARLLVTTDSGDPLIAVWRLGLGRVASFATDDGSIYAGELLQQEHSGVIIRSINWIIGDPERKKNNFLQIPDTYLGEETGMTYRGQTQPPFDDYSFSKIDRDLYAASFTPETTGFDEIYGTTYATNYKQEYAGIGMNPELYNLISSTEGLVFKESELNAMIDTLTSQAKVSRYQKWSFQWPFVLAALLLFLLDIFVRKLSKHRNI